MNTTKTYGDVSMVPASLLPTPTVSMPAVISGLGCDMPSWRDRVDSTGVEAIRIEGIRLHGTRGFAGTRTVTDHNSIASATTAVSVKAVATAAKQAAPPRGVPR